MASIRHQYILVGVETDPTRYHGEHPSRPEILNRSAAEQVLAHVAADLSGMFPVINQAALTMPGALFDITRILSPQSGVYAELESLQQSSQPGGEFTPRLLSIGASEGRMPIAGLQPDDDIPLGLLQILPVLVSGPADLIDTLCRDMEHLFIEQGQVSAHTAKALEPHFAVSVSHARFMTMTDLNALLRLQLEHYGFLPLWELIDTSINKPTEALEVKSAEGVKFIWKEGAVHGFFETFDWWARHGEGKDRPAGGLQLQSGYADWTREYRRYTTMLAGHGIRVCQYLPGLADSELTDTFLLEESTVTPAGSKASITEHTAGELGTVAVTVVSGQRQINLFPLQASGLNDLHRFIREQGFAGDSAFPGIICYDEHTRQLIADTLPPGPET